MPKVLAQRVERRVELLGRHGLGFAPRDVALRQWPRYREALSAMRRCASTISSSDTGFGRDPVTRLHFLDVADGLARQSPAGGEKSEDLGPQPPPPRPVVARRGAVVVEGHAGVEVDDERPGERHQLGRGADPGRPARAASSGGP